MMKTRCRRLFLFVLLVGVLSVQLGLIWAGPAIAAIRQMEETPGQQLYQSRETLPDQGGHRWQVIAFKRIRPDGKAAVYLRLVGFPGVVDIDRTQPLTLTNSLGQTWTAADATSAIFSEATEAQGNVGQYDLQPLVLQLPPEVPLTLSLPNQAGDTVQLSVPPSVIQEWQTVAQS